MTVSIDHILKNIIKMRPNFILKAWRVGVKTFNFEELVWDLEDKWKARLQDTSNSHVILKRQKILHFIMTNSIDVIVKNIIKMGPNLKSQN